MIFSGGGFPGDSQGDLGYFRVRPGLELPRIVHLSHDPGNSVNRQMVRGLCNPQHSLGVDAKIAVDLAANKCPAWIAAA
jgi:hypothetical protein